MSNLMNSGKPKEWGTNDMLRLEQLSPEDEARRFCYLVGWHHYGDTRVMLGSGGYLKLPEMLADYARQITAERDAWRKIAQDLQAVTLTKTIVLPEEK